MLFYAPEFLFVFLPVTLLGFFAVGRVFGPKGGVAWALAASLIFYGWWDWRYLGVLLPSIVFNYQISQALGPARPWLLWVGAGVNLLALGAFKYAAFAALSLNAVLGPGFVPVPEIGLPLGISFFTFTQIAYLVDCHRGKVSERDPLSYGLFVTYFPHLIAGPILHHAEMMPQFRSPTVARIDWSRAQSGFVLLLIGLFKKLVLADTFAQWVGPAFDHAPVLSFVEAWAASLSYSFQLYFDFSGYSDMAIGLGLMMNIVLPTNFNSPYRATNIQDFWRRWHMTLSRFLRDYLYIGLGGNRFGAARTLINLFLVFVIGGLWHGAGWTFVAWGAAHGLAAVVHRLWRQSGRVLPEAIGRVLTFAFVNAAWVLFRADTWEDAVKVYRGMIGLDGFALPDQIVALLPALGHVFTGVGTLAWVGGGTVMGLVETALLLASAAVIAQLPVNSQSLGRHRLVYCACAAAFPFVTQAVLFRQAASVFLYFRF